MLCRLPRMPECGSMINADMPRSSFIIATTSPYGTTMHDGGTVWPDHPYITAHQLEGGTENYRRFSVCNTRFAGLADGRYGRVLQRSTHSASRHRIARGLPQSGRRLFHRHLIAA